MGSTNPLHHEGSTSHNLSELKDRIYLILPPTGLDRHNQSSAGLPSCVTPSVKRLPVVQES